MKILLPLSILFFQILCVSQNSFSMPKLTQIQAQEILNNIRKCDQTLCFEKYFSAKTSKIELQRIHFLLQQKFSEDTKAWKNCTLNYIELQSSEVCFETELSSKIQTQYFFNFEKKTWKLSTFRNFEVD